LERNENLNGQDKNSGQVKRSASFKQNTPEMLEIVEMMN
jgi:hypothetical protein